MDNFFEKYFEAKINILDTKLELHLDNIDSTVSTC